MKRQRNFDSLKRFVRRCFGLCMVRLDESCWKRATKTLRPRFGTPSRMCDEHYRWFKFLEDWLDRSDGRRDEIGHEFDTSNLGDGA